MQWSTQPIYVLDKDNDLNVKDLALVNAADIIKIQPEGPYLLGGHSYGGTVAVEIAMVLESWGHEVGLCMVMDTPLPEQIRTAQPTAEAATDEDCLELMEMILGALGRDALGMGSSIQHPKESEEWRRMSMDERYEFFAPIWRIMRDDNMSVSQVQEQVSYVALVTKQAASVSDLRHHEFHSAALEAPVVYFRAKTPGVCTYFDDRRNPVQQQQHARQQLTQEQGQEQAVGGTLAVPSMPLVPALSHGARWYRLCSDLEVVDVPGDHFSLLRQGPEDMALVVSALKQRLGAFGWTETVRRDQKRFEVETVRRRRIEKNDSSPSLSVFVSFCFPPSTPL
jgi:thioesterase domain-containing protein